MWRLVAVKVMRGKGQSSSGQWKGQVDALVAKNPRNLIQNQTVVLKAETTVSFVETAEEQ